DGKILASVGLDWILRLWDPATGKEFGRIDTSNLEGKACRLTFSPDGKTLAAGGMDSAIRLWDVETRQTRAVLRGECSSWLLGFSPNGRILFTVDESASSLRLWDVATGKQRKWFQLPGSF